MSKNEADKWCDQREAMFNASQIKDNRRFFRKEIVKMLEFLSKKHDVRMDEIHISFRYGSVYIEKVKYDGLSGRDECTLLEIIEP